METLKEKTIMGFIWRFLERIGAQLVSFVVSIILARLLEPSVYGIIALVTVFTTILNVFIDSGLGVSLIQKKDADELDFNSVFWFNITMGTTLYAIMYILAPGISNMYKMPELTSVIRVLSVTLIISGIKNIQQTLVFKRMQFKKFFFSTLGGTIGAALLGIVMAYSGFGVWALVAQYLFNTFVDALILCFTVRWKPKFMFSLQRLKGLVSYGWKILASTLITTVYGKIKQMIIGKIYTAEDLAYYNRGDAWPYLFVSNINSSIDSVLMPVMSKEQDSIESVKNITRRAIRMSTYLIAPIMIGLMVIGTPLVRMLLTEKWLPSIPYMNIFCITYIFYPISTANLNAIKAMGRSDLLLKLEIRKKIVGIIAILITMRISVMALACSLLFTSFTSQLINTDPNKKLLQYGYIEQLKDVAPGILLAVCMGIIVYPLSFLNVPDIILIGIQVVSGIGIYMGGSVLFKLDSFYYFMSIIKDIRKRK